MKIMKEAGQFGVSVHASRWAGIQEQLPLLVITTGTRGECQKSSLFELFCFPLMSNWSVHQSTKEQLMPTQGIYRRWPPT